MIIIEKAKQSNETAKKYAYRVLKDNIVSLNLKPGEMINDMEIAAQLGISRTPVREAIIQHSNGSGIIEIFPQRGMRVAYIDLKKVYECRFLRITLEREMVRNACDLVKSEDISELRENINLQALYFREKNFRKVLEYDNRMHRRIYEICRCEMIYNQISESMIHYDRARNLETTISGYDRTIQDHRDLVDAIAKNDKDGAEKVIIGHLGRWMLNEKEVHEKFKSYFLKDETEIPQFLKQ
ncbi:MAG: GntR family transcriptional regulator [Eubacteriales bacterium]|nr:GntR family transcriptional regulator [Eubacteriales bacterium]